MTETAGTTQADWPVTLAVRELFAALLKARRGVRRYPPGHTLRDLGLRELERCASRILPRGGVAVDIHGSELIHDGQTVYTETPPETLLADLAAAGITGFTLGPRTTASSLREFACRSAEPPGSAVPEAVRTAWAGGITSENMPGIAAHSTLVGT